ncbi:TlpA family protein disulfide reductase [Sphingobacterium lumbrici]|uniref:TlpA family protein disulfide reductase n=1 Tax=Sphingobacterium lumbrici TaxID=2559600 RepID=UPI00112A19A5|nr:TlpA disulfide reductase family protein [Sphingobacterium lumbrici]
MQKIFILFLYFFPLTALAQDSIVVKLTNLTDSLVFSGSRTVTWIAPDSVKLSNIPTDIESYKVKIHSFSNELPPLMIFYGVTNSGKRQVIFDTDFDRDLKDEYVYTFDSDIQSNQKEREDSTMRAIPAIQVKYPGMEKEILLKPVVFNRVANYPNVQDSIWHLFVESNYDRVANFNVLGNTYHLFVRGQVSAFHAKSMFSCYIVREGDEFFKPSKHNPPHRLHDTIVVDGTQFVIDSVSPYLEKSWISYQSISGPIYGVRENEFAKNIVSKTITGEIFDLHSLKGNYILIDFWGSWCHPCIELIPKIRELHSTYHNKGLVILSVGCDKRGKFEKMMSIIEKENMDWLHVFTEYDKPLSIDNQYSISCYPTSVIIDKSGKIVYRSCGLHDFHHVKQKLDELMLAN